MEYGINDFCNFAYRYYFQIALSNLKINYCFDGLSMFEE